MKSCATLFLAVFSLMAPMAAADQTHPAGVPNLLQVDADVYRSGHPNAAGYDQYANLGIKSVVSLEEYHAADGASDAERRLAETHGMAFAWVPMSGSAKPELAQIEAALAQIEGLPKPVLVHCRYGHDRTGIVVGAYRITHDGWTADAAIKEMRDLGHMQALYWWDDVLFQVH